jgi:hypothetical protein
VTLGTYPALGLADARARALDKRHAIDVEKRDPAADERAARAVAAAYGWPSTRIQARPPTRSGFGYCSGSEALNHARYTVTARHYIKHGYEAEVRHALDTWDADLADLVAGRETSRAAVVPFRP